MRQRRSWKTSKQCCGRRCCRCPGLTRASPRLDNVCLRANPLVLLVQRSRLPHECPFFLCAAREPVSFCYTASRRNTNASPHLRPAVRHFRLLGGLLSLDSCKRELAWRWVCGTIERGERPAATTPRRMQTWMNDAHLAPLCRKLVLLLKHAPGGEGQKSATCDSESERCVPTVDACRAAGQHKDSQPPKPPLPYRRSFSLRRAACSSFSCCSAVGCAAVSPCAATSPARYMSVLGQGQTGAAKCQAEPT